jgi:peptide-methionine (R)-S-oxide reductase
MQAASRAPTVGDMHTKPADDPQVFPRSKAEEQWRVELSPQEYHVLREAGTERAFSGEYTDTEDLGVYSCRACGAELFRSSEKFHSGCGWPSFFSPLAGDAIIEIEDRSLGMVRTEVRCASCGSHLGHVFAGEGYGTPTDLRYCINSVSLRMEPEESKS